MLFPEFLRTSTFRLAAAFAVTFAASAVVLFVFIYWQTSLHKTARIDAFLKHDAAMLSHESEPEVFRAVSLRILGGFHRITYAGLFDAERRPLIGNLSTVPPGLRLDGRAHALDRLPTFAGMLDVGTVRMVGRRLKGGDVLVIGRNIDALRRIGDTVLRALELGVIPALLLAFMAGAFVSGRAQRRVKAVHRSAERIMSGDLRERLPVRGTGDDFDRLARSVNLMLDEIGRLLDSVKGAGNDIAQDLRTPLARLRARLERGKETAVTQDDLRRVADGAIGDLDAALTVVTTLLRIGQIEAGHRRPGFERFELGALVEEVGQIYQPLAEEAGIAVEIVVEPGLAVAGDRGLMLEAIANLTQNAIKFSAGGGTVRLMAQATADGPAVRVADTGPGIPPEERGRVFQRFYRLERDRQRDGSGLGLSLVAAIARHHGFDVTIDASAPGAVFTLLCRPARRNRHSRWSRRG